MVVKILVGVCGGIAYAFLNRITFSLNGIYWWLVLGLVFMICFLTATAIEYYRNRTVVQHNENVIGSNNIADGNQSIQIEDVIAGSTDATIGSENIAKGSQSIKINKARF